jgi:TRAP-type C4-dicarboxylate transport system substrate-binding protein
MARPLVWSAALLALIVPAATASAKELKLGTYLPPTHPIIKAYEEMGQAVAKDTGGSLTVKVFAGGTLGAGPFEQYKRAVEGTVDIADICHPFHAKVFVKTMLIVLPTPATSAVQATGRLWDVAETHLASDYKEVRNLLMYTVSQAVFISRAKAIRSLADFKGAKIMTPGAAFAPVLASFGATPVPMNLNDMYNALSTGVVDMVALPATSLLPPWRLADIAKSVSVGSTGLFNPCGAIMNKQAYDGLSAAEKQALDRHTGRGFSLKVAKIFDDWAAQALDAVRADKNVELIELGTDAKSAMMAAAAPAADKVAANIGAAEIYAALRK